MHAQSPHADMPAAWGFGGYVGFFTQPESMKEYFQIPVEFATEAGLHLKNV
jgi:hypothetical protein